MRLKAYAIWWDEKLGNVKLHQMIDMKKCPEREKIDMKKDAQMRKDCDEKDEKWFTYY